MKRVPALLFGNLAQLAMPDLKVRTYLDENAAFPPLPTGIVDAQDYSGQRQYFLRAFAWALTTKSTRVA